MSLTHLKYGKKTEILTYFTIFQSIVQRKCVRILAILCAAGIEHPEPWGLYCITIPPGQKNFICKYIYYDDTQKQLYWSNTISININIPWLKICYTPADGKALQPGVWKCVINKLLKMSYSLVGGNMLSELCGKDTFISVPWPIVRKCVYMAMWQNTFINVSWPILRKCANTPMW